MAETSSSRLTDEKLKDFRRDGCVIIPNFLEEAEIKSLREACTRLVEQYDPSSHPLTVFTTDNQKQARNKYFLESGDDVRFFLEEDALDEKGNLKTPKMLSLNKIGHALHWNVPEFRAVSFSEKVKSIAKKLDFVSPAVVQSMYIFKQPGYGGEVTPHQDSTFLSTEPLSCVGLWFALQDATLENGCLWFKPGSQRSPTARRFVRVVGPDGELTTELTGPQDKDDPEGYVAAPVTKGSLVLIHGCVDHKSARNTSNNSRHVYTFHMIERHETTWDNRNWLQPTPSMPFTGLYEN